MRLCFYVFASIFFKIGSSKVIHHDWVLEERMLANASFPVKIVAINKQFPGPRVVCNAGDTLVINVNNKLQRDVAIHWHGLLQKNASNMDGVPYISQTPILPGSSFKYIMNVGEQTGTYWYHAHSGLDAEFLFGPLIIYNRPEVWKSIVKYNPIYSYDYEKVLVLSELWKKDQKQILYELTHVPYVSIGHPNAIFVNGKSTLSPDVFKVKPNKRYRLRVIGALGHSLMTLRIPKHTFTVIEADGTMIDPIEVDYLLINSGQRYSIILETNQISADYTILLQIVDPSSDHLTYGKAILSYETNSRIRNTNKLIQLTRISNPINTWVIPMMKTSKWYLQQKNTHYYPPPKKVDQDIVLNVNSAKLDGLPVFKINNKLQRPGDFVHLLETPNAPNLFKMKLNQQVQLVLQQFSESGKSCVQHPWHLHGHDFHIVGQGSGIYDPKKDLLKINSSLNNLTTLPLYRDTFTQFPSQTPKLSDKSPIATSSPPSDETSVQNCGWIALRFITSNPGNWIMHCHITAHLVMGKLVTFQTI